MHLCFTFGKEPRVAKRALGEKKKVRAGKPDFVSEHGMEKKRDVKDPRRKRGWGRLRQGVLRKKKAEKK